MEPSFLLALAAMLFFGIQNFAMQVAAKRGKNSFIVTSAMMAVVSVFALIAMLLWPEQVPNWKFLIALAVLDGIVHGAIILTKIECLRFLPASIYMPFHRAGTVIVILYSLFFLGESISKANSMGILLTFVVVLLVATDSNSAQNANYKKGLVFAILSLIFGAAGNIIIKTAADNANPFIFTFIAYGLSSIFSIGAMKIIPQKHTSTWGCVRIGAFMGILNALGFFCMIYALKLGKASVTFPIIQLYILVSIILAMIVYKEKLNLRVCAEIALTILALLLLS